MKLLKPTLGVGALILGIVMQSLAQIVLPEIEILAVNYKYISSVNAKGAAQPVKMLELQAAAYDVTTAEFYEDEYDKYRVTFYIPEGQVLAAYDKNGNLLRTAEKFKDVSIPSNVRQAVAEKYPEWAMISDVYLVTFHNKKGVTRTYKILLEKGTQRMKVKVDENGAFL